MHIKKHSVKNRKGFFWSLCFITKLIMKSLHKIISNTSSTRKIKRKVIQKMKEKVYNSFFILFDVGIRLNMRI